MALQISSIPLFNPHNNQNSVSQRWTKLKKQFQYFILAASGVNDACQNALLLHMVGQETQDIYDTLNVQECEGTLYKTSVEALDQHFCIKKNISFERSIFHAAKQLEKESIEQYITQIRQLAQYCEYGNEIENNIRDQIISSCLSSKLRKRLLTEPYLTLNKLAQVAQAMEDASHYIKQIEEKNQILSQIPESLNKLILHKPQQNKQKHQHKQQQAQHYQPQKGCSQCGAKGHHAEVCHRSRNQKCHNCGKLGHFTNTCRTRKRHPPNLQTTTSKQIK